jgi:hypothetical protein
MRPAFLPVLCTALVACHVHHHDSGHADIVFQEEERNDDPLTANHFGSLRPGDRFFIDGFVRDDLLGPLVDPFDGFAFTAEVPLHVDFQLFIGNPAADLDVCLYDPQLDETLACFATADDPEQGGVDVFAGGLDFHLVVESFVGDSSYSLEVVVLPLFAVTAQGEGGSAGEIQGVEAHAEHAPRAAERYRLERAPGRPLARIEEQLFLDERLGTALSIVRIGGASR